MISSDDSIKQPLTARLESFDGTDEYSIHRNSPSPHSMLASQLNKSGAYHDYANPQDLIPQVEIELDKMDARKKKNLLYESNKTEPPKKLPPRNQNMHGSSNDNSVYDSNPQSKTIYYKYLLIIIGILALVAVVFSVLSIFGIVKVNNNSSGGNSNNGGESSEYKNNVNEKTPDKDKLKIVRGSSVSEETVHQLQQNYTTLTKVLLPSLQTKIQDLEEKLNAVPKETATGMPGLPGPSGAGDFSKCEYKTFTKNNRMNAEFPEKTVTKSTYVTESKDKFIMGVTCSTIGASEYGLKQSRSSDGNKQFVCVCAGAAKTDEFKSTNNIMSCRIHYWQCPMYT